VSTLRYEAIELPVAREERRAREKSAGLEWMRNEPQTGLVDALERAIYFAQQLGLAQMSDGLTAMIATAKPREVSPLTGDGHAKS
jgi:hypothetical protein